MPPLTDPLLGGTQQGVAAKAAAPAVRGTPRVAAPASAVPKAPIPALFQTRRPSGSVSLPMTAAGAFLPPGALVASPLPVSVSSGGNSPMSSGGVVGPASIRLPRPSGAKAGPVVLQRVVLPVGPQRFPSGQAAQQFAPASSVKVRAGGAMVALQPGPVAEAPFSSQSPGSASFGAATIGAVAAAGAVGGHFASSALESSQSASIEQLPLPGQPAGGQAAAPAANGLDHHAAAAPPPPPPPGPEERSPGSGGGTPGRNGFSPASVGEKAPPRVLSGEVHEETGLRLEQGGGHKSFNYVIVFPMPSHTTEEDENAFRKEHLAAGCTHKDLLLLLVTNTAAQEKLKASLQCDSLRGMRAATIQMFHSFFESIFASYGGPSGGDATIHNFVSVDHDELFMCVKLGDQVAESWADMGEYRLQLDISALEKLGIRISDQHHVIPAHAKFDLFQKTQGLLKLYEDEEEAGAPSVLRKVDRIRLTYDKITDYLNLDGFVRLGLVAHAYPCHDKVVSGRLLDSWANLRLIWSLSQPIQEVRDYFGEKIAFYFLFMELLARAELVLVLWSVPTYCLKVALEDTEYADVPQAAYAALLIFWIMGFAKAWRRAQAHYSNLWGTSGGYENDIKEPVNPRFTGKLRPSHLDENKLVLQPDKREQFFGAIFSAVVQVLFMVAIAVSVSVNQYYAAEADAKGNESAFQVAAFVLTLQIKVFDKLWAVVATILTDMEQHVKLHEYDQSKAHKTFLMKFINTFYSFFYVAFFQDVLDPKSCAQAGGCQKLLTNNLLIVYLTYISFGIVDMIMPVATMKFKVWHEARELRKKGKEAKELRFLELQAKMATYDGEESTSDYLQIVLPMYFFVLFSMVNPLLSVSLGFLAIITQIRADAWKLLAAFRRAFPDPADGIGVWNSAVTALEFWCIGVNILLVLTQLDVAKLLAFCPLAQEAVLRSPVVTKALIFFVLSNFFICCRILLDVLVKDEPSSIKLEKERQQVQLSRLFEKQTVEFKEHVCLWPAGRSPDLRCCKQG